MAAKPEAKEPTPAPEKEGAGASAGGSPKPGKGLWIAAIAAVIIAPVLSLGVAQYVLLPKLQKQLAGGLPAPQADAPAAAPAAAGAEGAKGPAVTGNTYDFANVVVNLAGTMGTRYLKCSFTVAGNTPTFKGVFEANKARLTDVTLNVLSSLTLSDLEEPGSKNVLRDKLVAAYNQALGSRMVDQVYFSDFLIQ